MEWSEGTGIQVFGISGLIIQGPKSSELSIDLNPFDCPDVDTRKAFPMQHPLHPQPYNCTLNPKP